MRNCSKPIFNAHVITLCACLLTILCSQTFAQELKTFVPGQPASASDVNANFNSLYQKVIALESRASALNCQTVQSRDQMMVSCPTGSKLTGGGFGLAGGQTDVAAGIRASKSVRNAWQCLPAEAVAGSFSCFARCCSAEVPDLGFGQYCTTNYRIQTPDPNFSSNVLYSMALAEGEFRVFPIEIDATFRFPPEDIGVASLLIRYEGQDYHVTNVDEACYRSGQSPFDCIAPWSNVNILEQAMLSGELVVAPGPLGILDEFQFSNDGNIAYRIQLTLDQGHTVDDARLNTSFVDVYPLVPGTGDREGGSCNEFELDFMTVTAGVPHNEPPRTNVSINATDFILYPSGVPFIWWNGNAFRMYACADAEPGRYSINYVARDGRGGKRWLGTVEFNVLSEARAGGAVVAR